MRWEAIFETAQGESEKIGIRRCHCITSQGMAQVKISEEEKRREKLPDQRYQVIIGDRATGASCTEHTMYILQMERHKATVCSLVVRGIGMEGMKECTRMVTPLQPRLYKQRTDVNER